MRKQHPDPESAIALALAALQRFYPDGSFRDAFDLVGADREPFERLAFACDEVAAALREINDILDPGWAGHGRAPEREYEAEPYEAVG